MNTKIIKFLILIFYIFILTKDTFAQSLSLERVAKIKACTGKITIEGSNATGTGFIISTDGLLLTCWHVIEPAIIRSPQDNSVIGFKKTTIQFNDGKSFELSFSLDLLKKDYNNALAYDYCLLKIITKQTTSFQFLKLGDFNTLQEGQEVYTCGYPLGIDQQFISKGIASTKYIDTSIIIKSNTEIKKFRRSQALLDLTLNKGNSGGAVVKIGATIDDDVVIGIADFIISPVGNDAENIIKQLQASSGGVSISGIDPNQLFANIIQVLNNSSIGVSGCVAINHFLDGYSIMNH